MKLFIVDDDRLVLEQLVIRFKDIEEHNVISATSIQDAKEIIKNPNLDFDIAIFDMVFKIENKEEGGLILLQELKKNKPNTKAIILTAYPTEKNEQECINAGAYSYFVKTKPLEQLVAEVYSVKKKK